MQNENQQSKAMKGLLIHFFFYQVFDYNTNVSEIHQHKKNAIIEREKKRIKDFFSVLHKTLGKNCFTHDKKFFFFFFYFI